MKEIVGGQMVDMVGGSLWVIGTIAMIPITATATQWILENLNMPSEVAYPIANVMGYVGGVGLGAFKGMGSKETFKKIGGYLGSCFAKERRPTPFKVKIADGVAGIFSIIGTASRAELVMQSGIHSVVFSDIIMACNILSTSCNDFFGWQSLLAVLTESKTPKSDLKKVLMKMKRRFHQNASVDALLTFKSIVNQ